MNEWQAVSGTRPPEGMQVRVYRREGLIHPSIGMDFRRNGRWAISNSSDEPAKFMELEMVPKINIFLGKTTSKES